MPRLLPGLLPAVLALGATAALAPGALAQDRPPNLQPTRDVSVQYRLLPGTNSPAPQGAPHTMTLTYSAELQAMRMDMGQGGYAILNRKANTMTMVMPAQHMYITMPSPVDAKMFEPGPDTVFTKQGTDTVAGISCTVWKVQSKEGDGQGCITTDGVMLRAEGSAKGDAPGGGQGGGMEAVSVDYATQPASLFAPPADYKKLDPAQLRGGPGGAPGGAPGGVPGGRPPG
jgi:hypothetical protein